MLAIAAGLVISVIMIPFTHFATTLRRRLAARTIQYRFRVRQKSRRFRTWWRQRPDPMSVMGRTTAWDDPKQAYYDYY